MCPSLHTKCEGKPQLGQVFFSMESRSFLCLFVLLPEEIDRARFLVVPPAVVIVLVVADFRIFQGAVVVAPFGDVIITRSGHGHALLSDHFAAAAGAGRAGCFDIIRNLASLYIAAVDAFEPRVFHIAYSSLLVLNFADTVTGRAGYGFCTLTIIAGVASIHCPVPIAARAANAAASAAISAGVISSHELLLS